MQNSAQKIEQQIKPEPSIVAVVESVTEVVTENVVEFETRNQLIAKQSEEACNLSGNPDFDVFEEKYGLTSFA